MKIASAIFTFCLLLSGPMVFSQDFQTVLESGKAEFKLQDKKDTADYSKTYKIFCEAVKLQPDNTEARYFLGYAIDRINSVDGSKMHLSGRALSIQASEQFEIINRLEPKYTGEVVSLDPYSKIGSIWGAQAMAYLNKHQSDSAKWAFIQGKKRGGFIEPVLSYNRQLLTCCEKNSILVTSGDNLTIILWYLQEMEQFRTDVVVIDVHMLNAGWYGKYLKHEKNLPISYSDEELDTLNYLAWKPTMIHIKKDSGVFDWELRPTYYDRYILKGDRILLDIFKQTLFTRPFYFFSASDSTNNLFLTNHLSDQGILSRVLTAKADTAVSNAARLKNLAAFSIEGLSPNEIVNSMDAQILLNGYRWAYYTASFERYEQGDIGGAKKLMDDMDKKFDAARFPYFSDAFLKGIEGFRSELH